MSTETEPRLRLEQYLGLQIKRQRQAQSLKLADVARIAGMDAALSAALQHPVSLAADPLMTGAIGAAILAARRQGGSV